MSTARRKLNRWGPQLRRSAWLITGEAKAFYVRAELGLDEAGKQLGERGAFRWRPGLQLSGYPVGQALSHDGHRAVAFRGE